MDLPIIRKLMEYSASWVKMPARMGGIPILVCRIAVTKPANAPAQKAATIAIATGTPLTIRRAATAPPVQMEPSTVKSEKSSSL